MSEYNLNTLDQRINELLALCTYLKEQNNALQARESQLLAERATLISKNERASQRVENVVDRLQSLKLL